MMGKIKILFVLDSLKYKQRHKKLKEKIVCLCDPYFYYTEYENRVIKFFHGIKGIGNFFSHISYWAISFLAACKLIIFNRNKYPQIVFINPIVGFFYGFFHSFFRLKDNYFIAGFLFVPKKEKFYFELRKKLVKYSFKNVSRIFVYSNSEVELYSEWFPTLACKFTFVRYGRDFDIFEEHQYDSKNQYIASGGVSSRDYNILICAMNILIDKYPQLTCRIATRPNTSTLGCKSNNVEFLYNIRTDIFGSFLEKSLFVILPLIKTPVSAGHMVLLESMYRGKIVLISDISAIRDYVDDDLVVFYKPDDYLNLAEKIEYLYQNIYTPDIKRKCIKMREVYKESYQFTSFLERIINEVSENLKSCT